MPNNKNIQKKKSVDGNKRIPTNFRFKKYENNEKEFSKILKEIKNFIKK
jgi:hypothetical protein